jgi:hypothetical protein
VIKSRRIRWMRYAACVRKMRIPYEILVWRKCIWERESDSYGEILWSRQWTFKSHKMWEIWLAERLLASRQEQAL